LSQNYQTNVVYQIRPFAIKFLRALKPFFDIIVYSRLDLNTLTQIVDHIETILNKPILDRIRKYAQNKININKKFMRIGSMPLSQIYFNFILHKGQYIHIEGAGQFVENLPLVHKNKPKDTVIFLSSNCFSVSMAVNLGYNTIPINTFDGYGNDDYQL
jgi:hypothetical protein